MVLGIASQTRIKVFFQMNGEAFIVLMKALKINGLRRGFNCPVLGQLLSISNLRFNFNVSFEFLCFNWFGDFVFIFHEREFDDLTFEKFEKIDFLFFHFGKIHENQ